MMRLVTYSLSVLAISLSLPLLAKPAYTGPDEGGQGPTFSQSLVQKRDGRKLCLGVRLGERSDAYEGEFLAGGCDDCFAAAEVSGILSGRTPKQGPRLTKKPERRLPCLLGIGEDGYQGHSLKRELHENLPIRLEPVEGSRGTPVEAEMA